MRDNPYQSPEVHGGDTRRSLSGGLLDCDNDGGLDDEQKAGRFIVLLHISLMLLISLAVIGTFVVVRGTERLPTQIVRFILTAALCMSVYRGSVTAKWITILLCGFAGIAGAAMVLQGGNPAAVSVWAALCTVYVSFAIALLGSPECGCFFDASIAIGLTRPPPRKTGQRLVPRRNLHPSGQPTTIVKTWLLPGVLNPASRSCQ